MALGFSAGQIQTRLARGEWIPVGPGVYKMRGSGDSWHTRVVAAVLGCGPRAAASHATAAHLHGLLRRPEDIEVVVPRGGRRGRAFVMHQSTDLETDHVTTVDGIPTTTVVRTIIDVGVPNGIGATASCMDEARRRGMVRLEEVAALLHRVARRGRRGVGPARKILMERLAWDQITESALEDRFLRILQRYELPQPVSQKEYRDARGVLIGRVDFAYPDHGVVVELDGARYHSDPATFRRDRQRQNALVLNGLRVIRFTSWDIMAAPDFVAEQVSAVLGKNRAGSPSLSSQERWDPSTESG